jgi:hypothetical protein
MSRKELVKPGRLTFGVMQNASASIQVPLRPQSCARAVVLCWVAVCGMTTLGNAWAGGTMYRCAGKPEIYTNQSWAASRAGCRPMGGGLLLPKSSATPARAHGRVTPVVHTAPTSHTSPMAAGPASVAADLAGQRVAPTLQAVRDQDRKRILEEELSHEQARLAALGDTIKQKQAKAPAVEMALLSQSSSRSQSNVQALQRELSRLRP